MIRTVKIFSMLIAVILAAFTLTAAAPDASAYAASGSTAGGAAAQTTASALEGRQIRLGGDTRIDTALAAARCGWPDGSRYVLLANAYSYADALAGVPLAGRLNAPILLTGGKSLESSVLEQIKALGADRAFILGGSSAVGSDIIAALDDNDINATRLSGADRFATAVSIARQLEDFNSDLPEYVFIACSANYPDALSAGAAAAALNCPVIYCRPNGIFDRETAEYLANKDNSLKIVLGGNAAITDAVYSQIEALCGGRYERVSGADRYATSLAVNRRFDEVLSGGNAVLATGESFPDALAGGALAAHFRSPVVLSSNSRVPDGLFDYLNARSPAQVCVMGGENALSSYAVSCLLTGTAITTKTTASTTKPTFAPQGSKKAYLTFDDGPSNNTKKILDILDRYDAKATFFVIYHSGMESVYKDIVKRGHTIALHSYTHEYSNIYSSTDAFWKDQQKIGDYVFKQTGVSPKIFRFPGGASNTVSRKYCKGVMSSLSKQAASKGLRYFDWSVDSGDASGNKVAASKISSNVLNGVGSQKAPVILMHDTSVKTTTVDALPGIIEGLKSKGYKLCAIDENTPDCKQKIAN